MKDEDTFRDHPSINLSKLYTLNYEVLKKWLTNPLRNQLVIKRWIINNQASYLHGSKLILAL